MFAVVRTGGKQYRVHPGDKIVVEKLDGNAGDKVTLGDVVLAGNGGDLKSTNGLTVSAEIVAQAKADKVTVFKKRRRHNYRRKQGHRQQHTILKIVAIGDYKHVPSKVEGEQKAAPAKAEAASKVETAPKGGAGKSPAARAKETAGAIANQHKANEVAGTPTENPAPNNQKAAGASKPAAKNAAVAKPAQSKPAQSKAEGKAKSGSTENAAPAKGAAKKTPKK
jgi:large subunit ribosomal protein L21